MYRNKVVMETQEDYPGTEKSRQRKNRRRLYICCLTTTDVERSYSLLNMIFCCRVVFLCFHSCLFLYFSQAHAYL